VILIALASPLSSAPRYLSDLCGSAPQQSLSHQCSPRPQPGTHIRSPTCIPQHSLVFPVLDQIRSYLRVFARTRPHSHAFARIRSYSLVFARIHQHSLVLACISSPASTVQRSPNRQHDPAGLHPRCRNHFRGTTVFSDLSRPRVWDGDARHVLAATAPRIRRSSPHPSSGRHGADRPMGPFSIG